MMESAWPVALALISIAIIVICLLAAFAGLDFRLGSEKYLSLKVTKRNKAAPAVFPPAQPAPETLPTSTEESATLAHQPVPQVLEPEGNEQGEPDAELRDVFWRYCSAENLSDLDAAYDPFIQGITPEMLEFWHTNHIRRREKLGADRGREAMRLLSTQQPTWAYPHAVMLEWALADHDLDEARRQLDAGLTKIKSPQFGDLLSVGMELIFKTEGKSAALRFACEWSRADLPESSRAYLFSVLSDLLKSIGDTEGARIALEFASSVQPKNESRSFNLAYSYAETSIRWASAVWHYRKCLRDKNDGPIALNNLGILYARLDKGVAIQTYERASREGDKYAAANLAHLLIEDGYLSLAQHLLDAVEDPGNAAELHADARKALLTEKRRIETRSQEIDDAANANCDQYQASLAAALRNLQRGEPATIEGFFASEDRNVIAEIDGDKARCRLREGECVFEGSLQNETTCFAGFMSTNGGSILGAEVGQFTMINEGNGTLRLFRWPRSVSLSNPPKVYKLVQVNEVAELAPPPDRSQPNVLASLAIANALLQKP